MMREEARLERVDRINDGCLCRRRGGGRILNEHVGRPTASFLGARPGRDAAPKDDAETQSTATDSICCKLRMYLSHWVYADRLRLPVNKQHVAGGPQ
jgi:hypothetical protein